MLVILSAGFAAAGCGSSKTSSNKVEARCTLKAKEEHPLACEETEKRIEQQEIKSKPNGSAACLESTHIVLEALERARQNNNTAEDSEEKDNRAEEEIRKERGLPAKGPDCSNQ